MIATRDQGKANYSWSLITLLIPTSNASPSKLGMISCPKYDNYTQFLLLKSQFLIYSNQILVFTQWTME